MADMRVRGLAELQRKLEAMADPKLTKEATKSALLKAGKVIQAEMVNRAPVMAMPQRAGSDALPPGAIRDGITISLVGDEREPGVSVGPNRFTAHQAQFVEYGHRQVTGGRSQATKRGYRGAGRQVVTVPAYPFIRPAGMAAGDAAVAAFQDEMKIQVAAAWEGKEITNGK